MRRRLLAKACLAAFMVVVAALPARAGTTNVNKVDGVNFQYTATDTNGVLTVNFTNPFNLVTQVNGGLVPPISAEFAQLTLSPTALTDDIPGQSGHFMPSLVSTQYGVTKLSPAGAPNVVFDYFITFGQAAQDALSLTGAIGLDPASAKTITVGGDTYDFSNFANFGTFTLSLGTQDTTDDVIYNTLKSGNGTFSGTGQFDQIAVPEPSGVVFAGICGAAAVLVRRRKK